MTATPDFASKITSAIKFEVGDFADRCLALYKGNIDASIKATYTDMYERIQSEIKGKIITTIGQKDSFDYSNIPEQRIRNIAQGYNYPDTTIEQYFNHATYPCKVWEDNKKNFTGFITGERIILQKEYDNYKHKENYYILTNYARIIGFHNNGQNVKCCIGWQELNFWIPAPYCRIMASLLAAELQEGNYATTCKSLIDFDAIVDTLKLIKNDLYDTKIVPLYVSDIKNENDELKAKYDAYTNDRKQLDADRAEFDAKKSQFDNYIKPYTDIESEKEDIVRERTRLKTEMDKMRLIAKKIQLERQQLETDKKVIDSIDIANI